MFPVRKALFMVFVMLCLANMQKASCQSGNSDEGRPKTVSYNGKNYLVEQSPGGFSIKITPQGTPVPIGIVAIRSGRITAMDPNNYDLVKGVYEAYKSGGATFEAPEHPALGAGSAAKTPVAGDSLSQVTFPAEGGAIVRDAAYGEIAFTSDGTKASNTRTSRNALMGSVTRELVAEYKGGDNPGGKAASIAKGSGKALLQSLNPRVHTHVDTRGNDEWVVSQITNGKKGDLAGTGDTTLYSMYDGVQRDPEKTLASAFLRSVNTCLQVAMEEAAKRRSAGEAVKFDPAATAAGQNALRELKRFEEAKK
jgi:hypothetical protein